MKNKTISFDFDNTLQFHRFHSEHGWLVDGPIEKMVEGLRVFSKAFRIIIVSSRLEREKEEILSFIEEHNLPVEEVHCLGLDKEKGPFLQSLDVFMHIDDQDQRI